jgi:hypothetical protein
VVSEEDQVGGVRERASATNRDQRRQSKKGACNAMPAKSCEREGMGSAMGMNGDGERRTGAKAATMSSVQCPVCSVQRAASVLT